MRYILIQPNTVERNLSGVCYEIYWLYCALKERGEKVNLFEDVTLVESDNIIENRYEVDIMVVIDLSSYPQLDLALEIKKTCEINGIDVCFAGYDPLIKSEDLEYWQDIETMSDIDILDGVFGYVKYVDQFDRALLSDCDSHFDIDIECSKIVPLFLSVGCRNKCPFCYVGYSRYPYGFMDRGQIKDTFDFCRENNYAVHFCDEDFLKHRELDFILENLKKNPIPYICLASSGSAEKAVRKYGVEYLKSTGMFLIEIGLEVYDEKVLKKNRNSTVRFLAEKDINIFWLTLTFLPDESIKNLNMLGLFLEEYGWEYDKVLPRLRTNATKGGLGQFYQPYHGTPYYDDIEEIGEVLTERPRRLEPSFIGNKFLEEKVVARKEDVEEDDLKWFELYNIPEETVRSLYADIKKSKKRVKDYEGVDAKIAIAVMARLGMV